MRLYYTPTSPFVRKVMLVAHETGQARSIETVLLRPSPLEADAGLSSDNPLNKIPALVRQGAPVLYDSAVICEYLDSLHAGRKLYPERGEARWRALRIAALCDGIVEAGVSAFYERHHRPKEMQWAPWVAGQTVKAKQGLDALERDAASFEADVDIAQIGAAAAIGWLEFRDVFGDLRAGRPTLFSWYERFRERPSMKATEPHA